MDIDDIGRWVLGADRRILLMKTIQQARVIKASDVAHMTDRSTQNISRAIKECEKLELIECITPEKQTWKKYMLTDRGQDVLKDLEKHKMI